MSVLRVINCLGAITLAFLSASGWSAGLDNESAEKPWVEAEVQMPAFPEKENLISFKVGAIDDTQYLIDDSSLSVGSDGVLHYTLVVISSSGAQNVSYEGMRCATAERRFYASGRPDKTWSKARSNQWFKIRGGSNNQYVELQTNYFCAVGATPVITAEDARRVLRNGGQSFSRNR